MLISETPLLFGSGSASSVIPPDAIPPFRLTRSFDASEVLSFTVKLRDVLPAAARSDLTVQRSSDREVDPYRRAGRPSRTKGSNVFKPRIVFWS